MKRKEKKIDRNQAKQSNIKKGLRYYSAHRSVCNGIKYHIKIMNIIINRITKPRVVWPHFIVSALMRFESKHCQHAWEKREAENNLCCLKENVFFYPLFFNFQFFFLPRRSSSIQCVIWECTLLSISSYTAENDHSIEWKTIDQIVLSITLLEWFQF